MKKTLLFCMAFLTLLCVVLTSCGGKTPQEAQTSAEASESNDIVTTAGTPSEDTTNPTDTATSEVTGAPQTTLEPETTGAGGLDDLNGTSGPDSDWTPDIQLP